MTTANGLSYEIGACGEKKVKGKWALLIKMDIAHFTMVPKPGRFDSLREFIWIVSWYCHLEIGSRWEPVP